MASQGVFDIAFDVAGASPRLDLDVVDDTANARELLNVLLCGVLLIVPVGGAGQSQRNRLEPRPGPTRSGRASPIEVMPTVRLAISSSDVFLSDA